MQQVRNGVLVRKCALCKEEIVVDRDINDNVIAYKGKYYHVEHFIQMINDRLNSKSTKKFEWQSAIDNIDCLKAETKRAINDFYTKEDVIQFIYKHYQVSTISKIIFTKLANVYAGSHIGMNIPLPPEHLLEMWGKQINYLHGLADKNKKMGKTMDKQRRINYDISVLINKYDSYLDWLQNNKIFSQDIEHNLVNKNKVDLQNLGRNSHLKKNNADDIDNLLDEIFD